MAKLENSFTDIGYWYIGLTDLGILTKLYQNSITKSFAAREGDWTWMHSGEALTEAAWGPKHPSNSTINSDDCAMLAVKNNQVSWEDHDCLSPDVKHHAVAPICQRDTTETQPQTTTEQPQTTTDQPITTTEQPITTAEQPITTTEQPITTTTPVCPSEWTEFNNNCYKFFDGILNSWTEADLRCLQEGGRLTSVHSDEEDKFLKSLVNMEGYWLGGYPSGNSWIWSDGTAFDYDNFYNTSPGHCFYQSSSYYDYGWSGVSCEMGFVNGISSICKMSQ